MKISYKWPTVSKSNGAQQAILTNRKTEEKVSTSEQTLGIGIAAVVFYYMSLVYIYGSSIVKINEIDGMKSFWTFIKSCIKDGSIFHLNTLSSSLQNAERIGTTVCLVLFLALLQGLFSYQNVYSDDPKRAPIIAFNYLIVLCWFLFLYIFPYKQVANGIKKTSKSHLFLAFCVLASIIINCFLLGNLYGEYYEENDVKSLTDIGYALVALAVFSGLTMLVNIDSISNYGKKLGFTRLGFFSHEAVAYSEMCCLILYGIFMILFIQFPPLPSAQLSCVMVPNTSTST